MRCSPTTKYARPPKLKENIGSSASSLTDRIPLGVRIVAFVKMLQLRPESRLECELALWSEARKDGDEGAQLHRIVITCGERIEIRGERSRCSACAEWSVGSYDVSVLVHHTLSDEAGEVVTADEAREFPFDLDCADHL